MLKYRSGDVLGMFSEFSVVQFGWCMGCMNGNKEKLGLKVVYYIYIEKKEIQYVISNYL